VKAPIDWHVSGCQRHGLRLLPGLALGLVWLAASAALAGEFKSERGFSLTYPDGWSAMSKEQQKDAADQAKAVLSKAPDINLDKVAVFLFNPTPASLGENVNVVVIAGRLPMDDASCSKYRNGLIEQYGRAGIHVSHTDCRLIKVGDRDAISWHCDAQFPGPVPLMRQWQVVLSSRRQSYIVTCTAPAAVYGQIEPVFTQIVHSVRIEPDKGFAWGDLSPVARYAILGAIAGGAVGGILALARRLRRRLPPATP